MLPSAFKRTFHKPLAQKNSMMTSTPITICILLLLLQLQILMTNQQKNLKVNEIPISTISIKVMSFKT